MVARKKLLSWFTVVGIYRDNNQVWVTHVRAEVAQDAQMLALTTGVIAEHEHCAPAVVEVFPGRLTGLSPATGLLALVEGTLIDLCDHITLEVRV